MKDKLRMAIRGAGLALARVLASDLYDQVSGERIGRALLVPWRGKIHVIGLTTAVGVKWIPQKRLTYWKQEIGFTKHPPPDYRNVRANSGSGDA